VVIAFLYKILSGKQDVNCKSKITNLPLMAKFNALAFLQRVNQELSKETRRQARLYKHTGLIL